MSTNGQGRSLSLPKASQLDVEEASTRTFQNVKANSDAAWRNKPTDALDALEQAVTSSNECDASGGSSATNTDFPSNPRTSARLRRKKLAMSDVVRQVIQKNGQGIGAGSLPSSGMGSSTVHTVDGDYCSRGTSTAVSGSGFVSPSPRMSRRSMYAPKNRHVRKPSDAQDLLKATRGGHERSNTVTMINLGGVFSDGVFHSEEDTEDTACHSRSIEEESERAAENTHKETTPLIPPVPSDGSNGAAGGRKQLPLRATVKREQRKCSISGALCWALRNSYTIRFSIPLTAVAWLLFYVFGNPDLDVLPDQNPSMAWWCNLAVRQIATLEMARILQYLVVDCLFVSTRSFKYFGPLLTLIAIQAKGWPFMIFWWGLIDLAILHGDNEFQCNWFYWTGYKIYSIPGSHHVLNSPEYLQIVLCLIIAGALTVVKRVYVGIRFGRRQYKTFAARLDTLIADVVLLNEIATLAANAEEIQHHVADARVARIVRQKAKADRGLSQVKWSSIRKDSSRDNSFGLTNDADENDDDDDDDDIDDDDDENADAASEHGSVKSFGTSSGSIPMKALLSGWQEPVTNSSVKG